MGTLKYFFIATKFIMPFIMDVNKKWTLLFVMGILESELDLGERSKNINCDRCEHLLQNALSFERKISNKNKSPYETS